MSRNMTRDEWHAFVSAGTRTGKLAVVRKDGSPHVVPIWFVLDGDDFVFTTGKTTTKGYALRRDGRAAICVDDDRPPFAFVSAAGAVRISEDLDEMLVWATHLGARYMGADAAEQFGRRNAVPGELLVRLTPNRVIAEVAIAD
jgi:PPOX class probable F420-dependent enzyme